MKVVKAQEGITAEFIKVQEIQGDMGEAERMQLLQQPDGDVILSLYNVEKGQTGSIEFCTRHGGGRYPIIAKKLRELIAELVKLDKSPWENTSEITTPKEIVVEQKTTLVPGSRFHLYSVLDCSEESPCCERRGEYNGYASGPLIFTCPNHCSCHD